MKPCKRCGFKSFRAGRETDGLCLYCIDHPEEHLVLFTQPGRRGIGMKKVEAQS